MHRENHLFLIKFWLEKACSTAPAFAVGARTTNALPAGGALPMRYPGSYPRSRREPLLLKNLTDVVFDGALGDRELFGDLAVVNPPPTRSATSSSRAVSRSVGGSSTAGGGCRSGTGMSVGGSCSSSPERAYSTACSSGIAFPCAHAPDQASSSSCECATLRRPS